ncbi:GDSL-like Lipase/Acylhydrolase family protein [Neorhodopirellula lusitana]|uniref:GDSL-like Lipase/Acylhydrolase family protein n=1 Tax=Neorhodopirellula lusitana TaxID=445327 RepID=A0ABY1Q4M8_9BACT|nr:SGNH/GDSL hydrolase family protein [Neorhodopirellula lusitana]SMP58119.1 GDSL-like Lipase/Acylhydrolase family protein [Neorhodopirellula lusitana]
MKNIHWIIALTWVLFAPLTPLKAFAESPIRPGDHIAIVGNTFADQLRVHGYLETLLLQHSPDNPVSIRNLGWGGDMLSARDRPTNFPSERSTLSDHQTDVIIACFGMGESFAGEHALEPFRQQLTAFIASHAGQQYNGKSDVRLILVSPIACEDLGNLTPKRDQRNNDLAAYTSVMRDVADNASVPFVDLFEPSLYLMNESAGPNLTQNGIHLNPFGYWALSRSFYRQLIVDEDGQAQQPWLLRLDANAVSNESTGVAITNLQVEPSGLSFNATETSLPSLPPPTDQTLPPQLDFQRDQLVVKNLKPGTYQLTIDGHPVTTAKSNEWADGIAIDHSPAHRELEAYREAVNDKNLQFVYSWKALNQVHIVGERKRSPSGRALPNEVIEFNELAKQRDAAIRQPLPRKTRRWQLTRIKN